MKPLHIFKTYFQQQELTQKSVGHLEHLKQEIFANTINNSQKNMNNHNKKLRFIKKMYTAPIISFMLILAVVTGVLGFIQATKNNSKKIFTFNDQVSAAELINRVEKKLGEQFSYRITGYSWCNVNENIPDDVPFLNHPDVLIRKEHEECVKNNGKLFFTQQVTVSASKNMQKREYIPQKWQKNTVEIDKKGNVMTGKNNVVTIDKDDKHYSFMALSKSTGGQNPEGVFVEYKQDTQKNVGALDQQFKQSNGKEIMLERLQEIKDDPNIKVELSETQENKKDVYKLTFKSRKMQFDAQQQKAISTDEWVRFQEQYFEKHTHRPLKSVSYKQGETGAFIRQESYYDEFNTTVDDGAFRTDIPPKGYRFVQGTISSFEVLPEMCTEKTCKYGSALNYQINVLTYKKKDGTVVDYPFDHQYGSILHPFDINVYESKQRFDSFEAAKNAQSLDFVQLAPKDAHGTKYKSYGKIGEKPFSVIRVETTKGSGSSKIEAIAIVEIPYSEKKLPQSHNLEFQYIHNDAVNQAGSCEKAYYRSKKHPHVQIVVSKAPIGDVCSMFWTNGEIVEHIGEFQQVVSYFDRKHKTLLTQSSIQYNNLGAYINFSQLENRCGNLVTLDFSDKNTEEKILSCQENLLPLKERENIISESKKLLLILEEEWK